MKKFITAAVAAAFSMGALAQDEIVAIHVLEYHQGDDGGYVESVGFDIDENFTEHGKALLGQRFVYNDPRRGIMNGVGGDTITWSVNPDRGPGVLNGVGAGNLGGQIFRYWNADFAEEQAKIMGVYANLDCTPPLVEVPHNPGLGRFEESRGRVVTTADTGADIRVIGFRNFIADPTPWGYTSQALAFVVTYGFRDPITGGLTDIDNDGNSDVAYRELYYNGWVQYIAPEKQGGRFDFLGITRTVFGFHNIALHEVGHTLSLDHFGTVGVHKNDGLRTKPANIMQPVAKALDGAV